MWSECKQAGATGVNEEPKRVELRVVAVHDQQVTQVLPRNQRRRIDKGSLQLFCRTMMAGEESVTGCFYVLPARAMKPREVNGARTNCGFSANPIPLQNLVLAKFPILQKHFTSSHAATPAAGAGEMSVCQW